MRAQATFGLRESVGYNKMATKKKTAAPRAPKAAAKVASKAAKTKAAARKPAAGSRSWLARRPCSIPTVDQALSFIERIA